MAQHLRVMVVSLGLVLLWAPQFRAIADEMFICDGNKIVRVAFEKLAHMKRTNACVAAHYGLEIKPVPAEPAALNTARSDKFQSGPVRAHRPAAKPAPKAKKADVQVSTKQATQKTQGRLPAQKAPSESRIFRSDEALPIEEISAEPSDYRNIRVLNAKTKPTQWYRHVY